MRLLSIFVSLSFFSPEITASPAGSMRLPAAPPGLAFVENRGQWPQATRFLSRRGAVTARLEAAAVSLQLRDPGRGLGLVVRLAFDDAPGEPVLSPERRVGGSHHFLLGSDPACWARDVPAYARVGYRGVRPGIDVEVHSTGDGSLEYDVVAQPGADLGAFSVRWEGVESMRIDGDGALVLDTRLGELRQPPPQTWQVGRGGERRPVPCRYRLDGGFRAGFDVTIENGGLPVVIDPVVDWATRIGGNGPDFAIAMQADADGTLVAGGVTDWAGAEFPEGWRYLAPGVLFDLSSTGDGNSWVSRLDARSGEVQWITFLGGARGEGLTSLAIDATGGITFGAGTASPDLPVTNGSAYRGGPEVPGGPGILDAFVTTLSADGREILYSTYLGGSGGSDYVLVVRASEGGPVVMGATWSDDFPVSGGALQLRHGGGGASDLFVARLAPGAGADLEGQLAYSTLLGGERAEPAGSYDLELRSDGTAALVSTTASASYPTTAGALQEAFGGGTLTDGVLTVLRLEAGLPPQEQLVYSTYLGRDQADAIADVAVGEDDSLWIVGWSSDGGLHASPDALQPAHGGKTDGFVARIVPDPSLAVEDQMPYFTYLGGGESDLAYVIERGPASELTLLGVTRSPDFPLSDGTFGPIRAGAPFDHWFLLRLDPTLPDADQLLASTALGAGSAPLSLASFDLLPDGRAVVMGQTGEHHVPALPPLGPAPVDAGGNALIFAVDLRDPRAVLRASGSPSSGMRFDSSGSTTPAGTEIVARDWDFGDGATATGQIVEHVFGPGRHRVTLKVTNDAGCFDREERRLPQVPCAGGVPAGWLAADIGLAPPLLPGAATAGGQDGGTSLSLCAGAGDIAAAADDFHFVHRPVAGDGALTARLSSLAGGAGGAKAGLMVRESLESGSRHAALVVEKRVLLDAFRLQLRFLAREEASGATDSRSVAGPAPVPPGVWLRLERLGSALVGSFSTTGAAGSFVEVSRVELDPPLAGEVFFGIAGAGNDPGAGAPFAPLSAAFEEIAFPGAAEPGFRRGDANTSGTVDISDAVAILGALFLGAGELACLDAADANDDGAVDLSDAVAGLGYLFLGRDPPPAPGPEACGLDPTPEAPALDCERPCP